MQNAMVLFDQFFGKSEGPAEPRTDSRQESSGFNLQDLVSGRGGLATGAIAGGLAGLLLGGKKPRKIAESALKVGGVALVGGLAFKAWQNWQANKSAASATDERFASAPAGTPFAPATAAEVEHLSHVLIRAMIAAATADGHVSGEEKKRIAEQLGALQMDAQHQAFIVDELSKPLDIDAVARGAAGPEQAAEIYTASLLVIDPNGAAERGYLAMLAARLKLDPGLVEHLHANAQAIVEPEPA